jgi:hypothetical protein
MCAATVMRALQPPRPTQESCFEERKKKRKGTEHLSLHLLLAEGLVKSTEFVITVEKSQKVIMKWILFTLVGLFLITMRSGLAQELQQRSEGFKSVFNCIVGQNALPCIRKRMNSEIDRIESQITGRNSQVPISKIIETSGSLLADGIHAIFGPKDNDTAIQDTENQDDSGIGKS